MPAVRSSAWISSCGNRKRCFGGGGEERRGEPNEDDRNHELHRSVRQAGGDETNNADGDANQQDSLHPKPIG